MIRRDITIELAKGLEARPVAVFVQVAGQYDCAIIVEYREKRVNAKSIMGMMTLGIDNGDDVIVTAEGPDEKEAVEKLLSFLGQNS